MAIGPVQLIVLGFNHPDFHGEIIAELERLRASDTVRVIDSLAVYKDADGERVDDAYRVGRAEPLELGDDLAVEVGVVESQYDQLHRSDSHVLALRFGSLLGTSIG